MNKSELVSSMAEKAGLKKQDAKKALEAFVETVSQQLKAGDKITLVGFGTFSVSERAARKGRNPQKPDQEIDIPAKKVAKFTVGSELKEAIK
ncbi:MAG: HU family DNA-binding protein [Bacteroidales bacterium]|jgi:DNA-binding protein HU-beta|nr:HU family DNA-binding protein [Bacteroidales bacterium]